jgi:putative membrane protein
MADMVKDHDKDVKEFQTEAKNGDDPDVKAWAAKTLPTLEDHDKQANEVAKKVGAEGNMKYKHEAKKEAKKEKKNPQ